MVKYKYEPLDEAGGQIRMLNLLPGLFESPVSISLFRASFKAEIISYEALSYTWGSPEDLAEINIITPEVSTLPVTMNLAQALQYLRYEDRTRVLWIDAICINQEDLQERSSQVKFMAHIYGKASRAVIWLGLAETYTPIAMRCISEIASSITVDWKIAKMDLNQESGAKQSFVEVAPFHKDEYQAMVSFLDLPWFHRLWVWQEAILSSPQTIVCQGHEETLWEHVRNAVFYFSWVQEPSLVQEISEIKKALTRVRTSTYFFCSALPQNQFGEIMQYTRHSKCTDPRDRIYAILSLLDNEIGDFGIKPDYTKSVSEVYRDAFVRFTNTTGFLYLFDTNADTGFNDVPSCVPNWHEQWGSSPQLNLGFPASNTVAVIQDLPNSVNLLGCSIDWIDLVEPLVIPKVPGDLTFMSILQQGVKRLTAQTADLRSESLCVQALIRSFLGGDYVELFHPSESAADRLNLEDRKQIASLLIQEHAVQEGQVSVHKDLLIKFRRNLDYAENRAIFKSTKGYFGLGPLRTQKGDKLVVPLGSDAVNVLRPTTSEEGYELIGNAYCDSFNAGEAFLGGLPGLWTLTQDLARRQWVYCDRATGVLQDEDPRLGRLPEGWKLAETASERGQPCPSTKYLNQNEMGVVLPSGDPRLSPDALRDRGVLLEWFNIF